MCGYSGMAYITERQVTRYDDGHGHRDLAQPLRQLRCRVLDLVALQEIFFGVTALTSNINKKRYSALYSKPL